MHQAFDRTRQDSRHLIGSFVAPASQEGAKEGFMVVELSREGMSVLRVAPKPGQSVPAGERGLSQRFSWLAVPLPERGAQVIALAQVVHRKRFGPLEMIGLRFEQMSAGDRALLDAYLDERDHLSFGARKLRH
jgi:hypothetical protein